MTIRLRAFIVLTAVVVSLAPLRASDESVAAARELYASAAYEDALLMLNRLRAGTPAGDEQVVIEQYRAFCLLALGRPGDAQQAIEVVVSSQPFYVPSDTEVSPRVRAAFTEVRRRMLPGIIQDRYALAKSAYDSKNFDAAVTGFQQVLTAIAHPDLGEVAGRAPLADIKTLASGFHQLSVASLAPPAPEPVRPEPVPVASIAEATLPEAVPVRVHPYGADDADVVPPVVVSQNLPSFDKSILSGSRPGMLEVIVDESGRVESAVLRMPIHPRYDARVIDAAKGWKYKPAMLDGQPVKFRKMVAIALKF